MTATASRSRVRLHLRCLRVLAPTLLVGCSILGLDSYDIGNCDADPAIAATQCHALCDDGTCSACSTYQCNPTSHRCELAPTDADHDGDPSIACGGADCDDANGAASSKHPEICDGVDNNCDGIIDEDVLRSTDVAFLGDAVGAAMPSVARDDQSGHTLASFVLPPEYPSTNPCLGLANDQTSSTKASTCLKVAVNPGVPSEPYSAVIDDGFPPVIATAYIRTDMCGGGFAMRSTSGGSVDPVCADGPASLPRIAADGSGVLATIYQAPIVARCSDVVPSTLVLRRSIDTANPGASAGAPDFLSINSASTRPAPIVKSPGNGWFVASTDEANGVALWLTIGLFGVQPVTIAPPLDQGQSFMGARSIDLAIAPYAGGFPADVPFAIVAEIGCAPSQPIHVAVGTMSFGERGVFAKARYDKVSYLDSGGMQAQAAPSIAWEGAPYNEWRITWIVDGKVRLRRVSTSGRVLGSAIEVDDSSGRAEAVAATYGQHANVVLVPPTNAVSQFIESITIGCKP